MKIVNNDTSIKSLNKLEIQDLITILVKRELVTMLSKVEIGDKGVISLERLAAIHCRLAQDGREELKILERHGIHANSISDADLKQLTEKKKDDDHDDDQ
jgi:hypothetical protein